MRRRIPSTLVLALALAAPWAGVTRLSAQVTGESTGLSPVLAATQAARTGLASQVQALPLGKSGTVGDYLRNVDGQAYLAVALARAQMIGGPRTISERVVQVRLDISGQLVADALAEVARARRSNLSPEQVLQAARPWTDRTFTATGSSTGEVIGSGAYRGRAGPVEGIQLPPPSAVAAQAAAEARAAKPNTPTPNASTTAETTAETAALQRRALIQTLTDRIALIELPSGQSGQALLRVPGMTDAIARAVLTPPSAPVESGAAPALTPAVDPNRLYESIRETVQQRGGELTPTDEAGWRAFQASVFSITREPSVRNNPDPLITFPTDQPPLWFFKSLESSGRAVNPDSKLLAARAAETNALAALRNDLLNITLKDGLTLGQAAQRDPRYDAVLNRALERARVLRIEYGDKGTADVKVATDARYLWQDLVVAVQG